MKEKTTKPESKSENESKDKKINNKNGLEEKDMDLSEEDKQLQEELELCVQRLQEPNQSLYMSALEVLRQQIKSATTSMTSVPKPLKFLRPHYQTLKQL